MAHIKQRPTTRGTRYDVRWNNRSFTAKSLDEALLAKIAVERGDDPKRVLPDATTLGDFLDGWEARWKLGKAVKTLEDARDARTHLAPLEPTRLSQLTAAMVEDQIAVVATDASRAAQKALAHLKKGLRSARDRGHVFDPRILTLKPPPHQAKPIRFLTWAEVEALSAFLDERVKRIVPIAALTGMRKGELFDLTDRQVNLTEGFVTLRVTKTKRPRKVWLSDHARQLLREQLLVRQPNPKGLVFATRTGHRLDTRFETGYRKAVKLAGVDGANFHSLRHTCAALMIRARCNEFEVAEQLGHFSKGKPDPTMVHKTYGWLYTGATEDAVKRLDVLLAEPAEEETA